MFEIECPFCNKEQEIEGEDMPNCACDSVDYECQHCEKEFKIGWYATAEVR